MSRHSYSSSRSRRNHRDDRSDLGTISESSSASFFSYDSSSSFFSSSYASVRRLATGPKTAFHVALIVVLTIAAATSWSAERTTAETQASMISEDAAGVSSPSTAVANTPASASDPLLREVVGVGAPDRLVAVAERALLGPSAEDNGGGASSSLSSSRGEQHFDVLRGGKFDDEAATRQQQAESDKATREAAGRESLQRQEVMAQEAMKLELLSSTASDVVTLPSSSDMREGGDPTKQGHSRHCVVHVHGLNHPGTELASHVLHSALSPLSSVMTDDAGTAEASTGNNRDGFGDRSAACLTPDEAANPQMWGRMWYCPPLARSVEIGADGGGLRAVAARRSDARDRLWKEWMPRWDDMRSKPYLIRQSPLLDVLYLERLGLGDATFHAVVMSHPFATALPFEGTGVLGESLPYDRKSLLFLWLDAWSHLLSLLSASGGGVENFVVVQYEAMAADEQQRRVGEEAPRTPLAELVRGGCGVEGDAIGALSDAGSLGTDAATGYRNSPNEQHREMLGPSVSSAASSRTDALARRDDCQRSPVCRELMDDLAPIVGVAFGYDLSDVDAFRRPPRGDSNDDDAVLFSHENRPTGITAERMRVLVDKYVDREW